jgi:hypothetical protein
MMCPHCGKHFSRNRSEIERAGRRARNQKLRVEMKAKGLSTHRGQPIRIPRLLTIQRKYLRVMKFRAKLGRPCNPVEQQRALTAKLTDGYVRRRIRRMTGLPAKLIPQSFVVAKRALLIVEREIKNG